MTEISNEEWGARFRARIVKRSGASEEAAQNTLDAVPMEEWRGGQRGARGCCG